MICMRGRRKLEEEVCLPYFHMLANPLPVELQTTIFPSAQDSKSTGHNVPMRTDACMRASLA